MPVQIILNKSLSIRLRIIRFKKGLISAIVQGFNNRVNKPTHEGTVVIIYSKGIYVIYSMNEVNCLFTIMKSHRKLAILS